MVLRVFDDVVSGAVGGAFYLVIGGAVCYAGYVAFRSARDWWRGGWAK